MSSPLGALEGRHWRWGWWTLLVASALGVALELVHALKLPFYLDPAHEVRRLMWTLAHAHGAALGLLNLALAVTLWRLDASAQHEPAPAEHALDDMTRDAPQPQTPQTSRALGRASGAMVTATICLPGGFFLGGVITHGGDPGLGIALAPVGAAALLGSLWSVARHVSARQRPRDPRPGA